LAIRVSAYVRGIILFMEREQKEILGRVLSLPLRRKVRLAWRLRKDRRVSQIAKLPLLLVIAYVATPINVLPRWIPIVRRFDNLLIGALGLWLFVKLVPNDLLDEHLGRLERRPDVIDTTAKVRS